MEIWNKSQLWESLLHMQGLHNYLLTWQCQVGINNFIMACFLLNFTTFPQNRLSFIIIPLCLFTLISNFSNVPLWNWMQIKNTIFSCFYCSFFIIWVVCFFYYYSHTKAHKHHVFMYNLGGRELKRGIKIYLFTYSHFVVKCPYIYCMSFCIFSPLIQLLHACTA